VALNKATLHGAVILAGTRTTGFGGIRIGIKGTSLYTNPDGSGNFLIDNLPTGNRVVEVFVMSDLSEIPLGDVQSGEEIRITVEVQANNQAVLVDMNKNKKFTGVLQVQIQPKKWNLNWSESLDAVTAKISGEGFNTIHQDSVEIFGPDGILKIENTHLLFEAGDTFFKAIFSQLDAIALIADPLTGMEYEITVKGTYGQDYQPFELRDKIQIVGKTPVDTEELSFQVNPRKWNTNWEKSSGIITVIFRGEGYALINPAAIVMIGPDDPDGPDDVDVIYPVTSNLTEDQLVVKFSNRDAISIIPDPSPGDKHIILITDDPNGFGTFSFNYAIEIVGPKK
jgi:hypothetical protein